MAKRKSSSRKKSSTRKKKSNKRFIQGAIKKPGSLRRTAKVKKGQKIPVSTLQKLKKSKNPTTRRRATLALTLRRMGNRRKKGK